MPKRREHAAARRWTPSVLLALVAAIALALAAAGCGSGGPQAEGNAAADAAAAGCPSGNPVSQAALRRDVGYLAGPELEGRAPGTEGDRAARRYIVERFRCLGLVPAGADGGYQRPFTTSEGDRTANVVGLLPGADPERRRGAIVVGAHHDHLGRRGSRVFPGANDNASGTTAMLAVAAELSARPEPLRRPVIFAAFGAEETIRSAPFLEGSVRFLRDLPFGLGPREIASMVNLDMVGTYPGRGHLNVFGPRPGDRNYRAVRAAERGLRTDLSLRFPGDDAPGYSDAWPFERRGIETAFFHTPDPDCYHSPCDRPGHLSYGPMSRISLLAAATAAELAGAG